MTDPQTDPRTNLLKVAIAAVAKASKVTRHVQGELHRVREITKDDRSPVTVADFAAQAVVVHHLAEALGDFRLVGEESAGVLRSDEQAPVRDAVVEAVRIVWPEATAEAVLDAIDAGDHDATAESYWTLDPVDGTKGFLRGGQYAVSLAFITDGEVVLGAMGCPNLSADFDHPFDTQDAHGLIYFASQGGGAHCVPSDAPDSTPQRLEGAAAGERIRVCESVESGHTKQDDSARIVERLGGAGQPARLDSQCKYAVVARGQADAYLRLPTRPGYVEKIWDHAAGKLVAEEAGVVVTDITGAALDFSQGAGLKRNRGVICAHRTFHQRIIDAILELGIAQSADSA